MDDVRLYDLMRNVFWSLVEKVIFDDSLGPFLNLILVLLLIAVICRSWAHRRGR